MSYFSTDGVTPNMAWCAVYDAATGRVIHVHEFIGDSLADENEHMAALRAETALAHVKRHTRKDVAGLAVAHGDPRKQPQPGDRFAFDLKKKKLNTTRSLVTVQDVAKAASAKKKHGSAE